ncbi:multicopper oxidase family protein [bacterium]|nr:multicopper oxidase family protein [bacterium]
MRKRIPEVPLMLVSAIILSSCGGSGAVALDRNPGSELRQPAVAKDIDPDPDIVHVQLTAAPLVVEFEPGVPTEVWAYNGSFPGPLIEAKQGDRIIVDLTNNLPEETTIHWHGVRLSNANDGTPITQDPVPPGGSFTYDFTVPDASLFWYHPHANSAEQVYRGLYGPLQVHGEDPLPAADERVLVLSDIELSGGQLVLPWADGVQQMENAMGYLGNTQLVNGQLMPELRVRSGGLERWRVVNASGSRYYNLALPGHVFTMVGTDGGLIESPVEYSEFLLAPGERADLLVATDGSDGDSPVLINASYSIMHAAGFMPDPDHPLMQLRYSGSVNGLDRSIPAQLATITEPVVDAGEFSLQFSAALDPQPMDIIAGTVNEDAPINFASFAINGRPWPDAAEHVSQLGTTERWTLNNHTVMDHPFHLHGYRFLVESGTDGGPAYRGWKDTVNVHGSELGDHHLDILIPFEDNPGNWLYHCHILRHAELGMMAELVVNP